MEYFHEFFTVIIISAMFLCLIKNKYETAVIFFLGSMAFLATKIITIDDILMGFSNKGLLTIVALFIIAGKIQKSPYIYLFSEKIFKKDFDKNISFFRIMIPIGIISAFVNNIPLVSVIAPMARRWGIDNGVAPSKLLIPISYASIFGGILTLVGTSTNIVVSGLLESEGYDGIGMFEMTKITAVLFLFGIFYMTFIGRKLLPSNRDIIETTKRRYKDYLVTMKVSSDCKIIGKTVTEARLRSLEGLYLFEIIRGDLRVHPIDPDKVKIELNDELIFVGKVDTISQLQRIEGLELQISSNTYMEDLENGSAKFLEVVISEEFPFLNQSIRESRFRSRYNAAVVAVVRKGKRINQKIGNIKLEQGDTLLIIATDDFLDKWFDSRDFYIVSENSDYKIREGASSILSIVLLIMVIILSALRIVPILEGSLFSVAILFFTRNISTSEAFEYINWSTVITIALSFSMGTAIVNSGLSELISSEILINSSRYGEIAIYSAIFLFTSIFTELITNNSAAILMFPIGMDIATKLGLDHRGIAIIIAIAASTSFASPIGYQTNLMVYGLGGYKFSDFMRAGLPLNIGFMVLTIILINILG